MWLSTTLYGPLGADLFVDRGRLAPNIAYHGSVDPLRVPALMAVHDVLVLPTRFDGEGYPGVVIEAFQSGLPVVVTGLSPVSEIAVDGVNALVLPTGSAAELAAAIDRLSGDPWLWRRLSCGASESGDAYRTAAQVRQLAAWCAAHASAGFAPRSLSSKSHESETRGRACGG